MAASQHLFSRACPACRASDQLSGRPFSRPSIVSHRLRERNSVVAHAGPAASKAPAQQAKSKLNQLAGRKYGHNLTESQKQEVRDVIKQLEAVQSGDMRKQELAGTNWQLLYTESTGSSGGKVGPFVGQVDQAKCCLACAVYLLSCITGVLQPGILPSLRRTSVVSHHRGPAI